MNVKYFLFFFLSLLKHPVSDSEINGKPKIKGFRTLNLNTDMHFLLTGCPLVEIRIYLDMSSNKIIMPVMANIYTFRTGRDGRECELKSERAA